MGINIFLALLLSLSFFIYLIPIKSSNSSKTIKDLPLVIFEKPTMYTINEKYISRVAKAKNAYKYKNRDEFENADIILRNIDEEKDYKFENLEALQIIKKDNILELKKRVNYKRDDFISFKTDELLYDLTKKIAYNNLPFEGRYNRHFVSGKDLILDSKKSELKAKDIHFEFDLENKGIKK